MTNKERFMTLVSTEKTNTVERIKERIKNREMLRESQQIALKVLVKLDEVGWSQKRLAEELKVSPQQVNKILQGKENLTLDTQLKLQKALDIPILASYYEAQFKIIEKFILSFKDMGKYSLSKPVEPNYSTGKIVKMQPNTFSYHFSYQKVV